jgi:DNA end-binding protein Ku
VLLREALEKAESVALVKVAIRTRESLATLRVRDGVLVLETMVWPDEVRTPDFGFLDEDITVRPQELAMAESLIESMSADFDPDQYHDEYRGALEQVIEAKVEGREVVEQPVQEEDTGSVVDLMAALRASVAAAKKGRGEDAGSDSDDKPAARKTAAKKAPAKKAPAKKAAAKKAPAKKAAAKKSA